MIKWRRHIVFIDKFGVILVIGYILKINNLN
jgi:hypothetical protein